MVLLPSRKDYSMCLLQDLRLSRHNYKHMEPYFWHLLTCRWYLKIFYLSLWYSSKKSSWLWTGTSNLKPIMCKDFEWLNLLFEQQQFYCSNTWFFIFQYKWLELQSLCNMKWPKLERKDAKYNQYWKNCSPQLCLKGKICLLSWCTGGQRLSLLLHYYQWLL